MIRARVTAIALSLSLLAVGALVSPVYAASCGKQQYQDGTVGPSVCSNGEPNTRVKKAYTRNAPAVMKLKSSSTRKQLQAAVCTDAVSPTHFASNSALWDAIDFQRARYGWKSTIYKPVIRRMDLDSRTC
jgi:hypothetical protein